MPPAPPEARSTSARVSSASFHHPKSTATTTTTPVISPVSLMQSQDPTLVEVLPQKLYYSANSTRPASHGVDLVEGNRRYHAFSTDHSLIYWNFFLDFGPLNLGQVYRFCEALDAKLADPVNEVIIYYSAALGQRQANSVFLLGAYQLLRLGRTADQAFAPFKHLKLPPFHDATPGVCTYKLTVLDCLRGMERARALGFLDFDSFNVEEYEHFEKVESGDLSWIFPGRFLAFAGPHEEKSYDEMYPTCVPEDYHDYFLKRNVRTVVRLNKKYYDENRFKSVGIHHEELYYPDGSCPSDAILQRFLTICEARTDHAIAVHCKAGLGRTGTCIGAFAMKHWGFTAAEVIGWMRVARPGSVIGPQQAYLEAIEPRMHADGNRMRKSAAAAAASTSSGGHGSSPVLTKTSLTMSASLGSTSTQSTSAASEDEMDATTITQGDRLLNAKLNSPGAPKDKRKTLNVVLDLSPTSSDSQQQQAGQQPFYSLRTVARKLYGGKA